ncbi:CAAX prenyl protease-related protein [Candidatus Poribacteria bacterium]|nr:CAAX prenyl protease-related protein [Candidatus Poribacteria bacterium]
MPYVLPFGIFLVLTELTSRAPTWLVWMYPLKAILVAVLLLQFRRSYPEIQLKGGQTQGPLLLAFIPGLGVLGIWILPGLMNWKVPPLPLLGQPSEFDPYIKLPSKDWAMVWIGFRLFGAVVVVPVMEELFWRSFLLRYLIQPDFKSVPIGAFSWLSFGATVFLFGVEHHQWLVGLFAGIIYNLLLYRTKSIFACILAHAITNLALGVYVLATHQWGYW